MKLVIEYPFIAFQYSDVESSSSFNLDETIKFCRKNQLYIFTI